MGREMGLPISSSLLSRRVMGRVILSCWSARMAARAMTTPAFMSRTPGPA